MGCERVELPFILEAIEDKIRHMCRDKIPPRCLDIIHEVINDFRGYGKDYVRSKYEI